VKISLLDLESVNPQLIRSQQHQPAYSLLIHLIPGGIMTNTMPPLPDTPPLPAQPPSPPRRGLSAAAAGLLGLAAGAGLTGAV
jgi:hypothetical protein